MKFYLLLIISFASTIYKVNGQVEKFNEKADIFLNTYVKNGLVNYKDVNDNIDNAQHLYDLIGTTTLESSSDEDIKAFYINAYNIIVIYQVARYYPLKSPLDKSGFFDKVRHKVAGENITLNYLEIFKLLQKFKDARIHFGIACAAISCPPLSNKGFSGQNVEEQLEQLTIEALNNRSFIRVNNSKRTVAISKIFDWYKKDFNHDSATTLAYINRYRSSKIPDDYKVLYYEYDWNLNEQN